MSDFLGFLQIMGVIVIINLLVFFYQKSRDKRNDKKIIEEQMNNILLKSLKKNPMENTPMEGFFIQEAILEAGDQTKRAVLYNNGFSVNRELISTLNVDEINDVVAKFEKELANSYLEY